MNMLTSPSKKTNFFQVLLTICVVLLAQFNVKSQSNVVLCLGQDATICPVQTVTINDCGTVGGGSGSGTNPYAITNIPYKVNILPRKKPIHCGKNVGFLDK